MNHSSLALFLDRDGIINVDKGYVYKWDDIEWIEETMELMRKANSLGIKIIVLTNQSGVEKGKYSENDVLNLHQKMHEYLLQKSIFVSDWYYCLELNGPRRKPNPGMILEAQNKHHLNLSHSIMIGDKVSDIFKISPPENGPFTFIVRGAYDVSSIENNLPPKVKLLENHREMLDVVSSLLKDL